MDTDLDLRVYVGMDDPAADVLGLWQTAPGDAGMTVWEISAEDSFSRRQVWLQETATRVAGMAYAASTANTRLARFLSRGDGQAAAFGAGAATMGGAERRLKALLAPPTPVFGPGVLREDLRAAAQDASAFVGQMRRMIGQPVVVRSRAAGRTLGVTGVSWIGDTRTTWRSGLRMGDTNLHRRVVELALVTFRSWLRIAALTAACAAKLALLAPAGVGLLAALPTAWRFVTDILAEYRLLQGAGI